MTKFGSVIALYLSDAYRIVDYRMKSHQRSLQVLQLCGQLESLLEAGFPLQQSLRHMHLFGDDMADTKFRRMLAELGLSAVERGEPLSSAWRNDVPKLLQVFLKMGEQSGDIPGCLRRWKAIEDNRRQLMSQLIRALSYPILLLFTTLCLLLFIELYVVPTFHNMYAQLTGGQAFKSPVQHTHVIRWTGIIVIVTFCFIYGSKRLFKRSSTAVVKRVMIHSVLRVFTEFRMLHRTYLLCLLLHILLSAGISIVEAVEKIVQTTELKWLVTAAEVAKMRILNGQSIADAFGREWHPLLYPSLQLGMQTGDIAGTFGRMENYCQQMWVRRTQSLVKWLEPVLILCMGASVALTMAMLFVPMYDVMTSLLKEVPS